MRNREKGFIPFPFQIEPMDLVADERYNSMVLMWASQVLGKTEVINSVIGWGIEQGKGGGILVLLPTILLAQSWSKLRLAPMLEDLGQTDEDKPRGGRPAKGQNQETVQLKVWADTFLVVGGANSPAGLSFYSCWLMCFDEVDRYPPTVATRGNVEGDVITVTERRGETFEDSFSIKTSTTTTKDLSRIEAELEETDYRKWHVNCLACKKPWVIMWHDIRWPKGPRGEHLTEQAYLECPHCGKRFDDEQRKQMVRKGRWIATRAVKNNPGFWANAFITLIRHKRKFVSRLHQWAEEWITAKRKGPDTHRTVINQVLNESYEDPAEKPAKAEALYARRETYVGAELDRDRFVLPAEVLLLVAGVDTQADRLEASVIGFGMDEEAWVIEHSIFKGNLAEPVIWKELQTYLGQKWRHPSGQELGLAGIGMDSGGNQTERVYKFTRRAGLRNFWAVRGMRGHEVPWVQKSPSRPGLLSLYVNVGKATIYSRLAMVEPGPGFIHFGQNLDLAYFEQLVSERLVTRKEDGQFVRTFDLPAGKRNETLDSFNYALAALYTLRFSWKKLASALAVKADGEPGAQEPGTGPEERAIEPEPGGPVPAQPPPVQVVRPTRQRPRRIWG